MIINMPRMPGKNTLNNKKCFCGHLLKDHGLYVNEGTNAKGSRFVCQKDGCCRWSYCDLDIKK